MDRFAEPSISDAEWAPLHAQLVERIPGTWENTRPSDVPVVLERVGREFVCALSIRAVGPECRREVDMTVRALAGHLARNNRRDTIGLWTAIRAIGCLGIGDRHLLDRLMLLGMSQDGRTAVELAHAFARIGEFRGGVAVHLLHMHLTVRSVEARRAARRALVHLGPPATAEVIDLLPSSWSMSGRFTDARSSSPSEYDEVGQHARTFFRTVASATAPPHALDADDPWFDDVRSSAVDSERLAQWESDQPGERAARHAAAIWLLREAVPASGATP